MSSRTPQRQRRTITTNTVKPRPFLHHHYDGWVIAIIAVAAILAGIIILGTLFGMQRNLTGFYTIQDVLAGIAWLAGLCGLLLYIARVKKWSLPHALTLDWDGQETNIRLLTFSLIALILPVILVVMHHVL